MKRNKHQKPYMFLLTCVICLFVTLVTTGCSTPSVKTIEESDYSSKLQFLIDGKTTREEIILKLGEPSGVFEADRIFTYIISIDNEGKLRVMPRQLALKGSDPRLYSLNPELLSLVLVFHKDNILEKHSLVGSKDVIK